ncbi:hypothetical protein B0H11DRAFT_2355580 [Mycena galericulata]|nr:hypothetical protein B0H11DRAFT_2355580 [Mycena galericulata]
MSARLTGEDLRLCMAWLGPWLVGGCIDLLLQGILSCQFVNYFTWYGDDKITLRVVVSILVLLTVLESIHAFAVVWIQSIVYFGDLQGAILLNYTAWWQSGTPLMTATIGLYVQSYFCYRLFVISKKWYVVAPIVTLFVFAYLSMVVGTLFIATANDAKIGVCFAAHLSSVFAGDVTLALTTAYFLLRTRKDALAQTSGLLNALVRLTFQTAAPAAICAMFNLVFSQVNPGGSGITSTAFNMALPKLYSVSMMYTLNARSSIRATHANKTGVTGSNTEISGARSRTQRRQGDVELGHIHVQTEISQHIDVRDMFDPSAKDGGLSHGHIDTTKSDEESVKYAT